MALTLALLVLAVAADSLGRPGVADSLFWQNGLLQHLAPLHNVGTPERPVYEGSPINFLAFLASIPLGIFVYTVVAYLVLHHRRRVASQFVQAELASLRQPPGRTSLPCFRLLSSSRLYSFFRPPLLFVSFPRVRFFFPVFFFFFFFF